MVEQLKGANRAVQTVAITGIAPRQARLRNTKASTNINLTSQTSKLNKKGGTGMNHNKAERERVCISCIPISKVICIVIVLALILQILNIMHVDAASQLTPKEGYNIIYHNDGEWMIGNDTNGITSCDNCEIENTTGRTCIHFLNAEVFSFNSSSFNATGSKPTSLDDPRWDDNTFNYIYYKGGIAFKCTDDTIWYVRYELKYTNAYGDEYGVAYWEDDYWYIYDKNNNLKYTRYSTTPYKRLQDLEIKDSHGLNLFMGVMGDSFRMYWVMATTDCDKGINGKCLKNTAFFVWGADNNSVNHYLPTVVNYSFNFGSSSKEYWYNGGYNSYFYGKENIVALEGARYYSGYGNLSPSYALARYGIRSTGLFENLKPGKGEIEAAYDSSGNLIYISDAACGFEIGQHTHTVYRYKCLGHYEVKTFTIYFDYNKPANASATMQGNSIASKEVTYGQPVGTLPSPTLVGWTFNGWYYPYADQYITEDTVWEWDVDAATLSLQ